MSETISQNNLDDKLSTEQMLDSKLDNSNIKDNGAEDVDEVTPNKKLKLSNDVNDEKEVLTPSGRGRPSKDKSAKRLTILEKTTKEGEALLKGLGHKADDDPDSTKRRTRSQTRGTPPAAPPAAKKSPQKASQKESSGTTPKRRGRPPKTSITNNNSVEKTEVNAKKIEKNESNDTESQEKVNNTNNTDGSTNEEEHKEKESNTNENEEEDERTSEQNDDFSEIDNNNKPNSISDDTSNSAVETNVTTD